MQCVGAHWGNGLNIEVSRNLCDLRLEGRGEDLASVADGDQGGVTAIRGRSDVHSEFILGVKTILTRPVAGEQPIRQDGQEMVEGPDKPWAVRSDGGDLLAGGIR